MLDARVADDCDDAPSEPGGETVEATSGVEGYDGGCNPNEHWEVASRDASAGSGVGHSVDEIPGEQVTTWEG